LLLQPPLLRPLLLPHQLRRNNAIVIETFLEKAGLSPAFSMGKAHVRRQSLPVAVFMSVK
ncbi:hypothetical protein, partial [Mesorhizobium sp.]|uniref:hypothetical protein n=1 Tax=Mesorhizobium sp. TaxID=1871066 RepID=UPI00257FD57A